MTNDIPPNGEMTMLEYLAQHPLFWDITKEHLPVDAEPFSNATLAAVRHLLKKRADEVPELLALSKIAEEFNFKKGAILAHQREYADTIHILRIGRLETQYERDVTIDGNRKERVLVRHAIHLPGAVLDDNWLFTKHLYPYYIKALTDGKMILINRDKFLAYLKSYPRALRRIFPHFTPGAQDYIRHSRFQDYLRVGGFLEALLAYLPQRRSKRTLDADLADKYDPRLARLHKKFNLDTEESIRFQSQRSPWILLPRLILPIALLIGLLLLAYFFVTALALDTSGLGFRIVFGLALAVPLGLAILQYIDWSNDWFLVTDKQIIQYEFELFRFRQQLEKISIDKIQSIEIETPNFFARLLNLGTVRITTAAQSEVILFDFITQPKDVEKVVKEVQAQDRSVASAKARRTARNAAESFFNLPKPYDKITYVAKKETNWVKESLGQVGKAVSSFSHRSEKDGVVTFHKHRITLLGAVAPPTLMFMLLIATWYILRYFVGITFDSTLGIAIVTILLLVNVGLFAWQVADWLNDTYQITKQYVIDIDRAPFGFRESRKQAELSRVENVRTEQFGLISNIFDFGRVYVETAGATSSIVFENVANPKSIQSELFKRLSDFKKKQEEGAEERRRNEIAIFIDQYDKIKKLEAIPEQKPLLEEHEEGAPPE